MTRWARSGNTQKHKKMPGEATPWEEFSTAAKLETASKGSNGNKILKGRIEKKKHNLKRKFELNDSKKLVKHFDFQSTKANEVKDLFTNETSKGKFSKKMIFSNSADNEGFDNPVKCSSLDYEGSSNNIQRNMSRKISSNDEPEKNISASPGIENNRTQTTKVLTKRQLKKAKSKMKIIASDIMRSSMSDYEAVKNQDLEFSADNNASTDVIPEDETTDMGQDFDAEKKDLDIGSNNAPTTKVLTKRQLKKAKSKMKLITLDVLRSGRYDCEVSDNQEKETATESHKSPSATILAKKKIMNSKKSKGKISENTGYVALLENDVKTIEQEDKIQKKSTENSVEAQNILLSKNETSKCDDTTDVKRLTKNQWRKARIKRKFELLKATQASEDKEIKSDNQTDKNSPMSTAEKDPPNEKKLPLEKPERKRQEKSWVKLSPSVESKLSDLKKTLSEKGMSSKKIKIIIRKERKREKLLFKRKFGAKPCFNCRKKGHLLSDCPLPLGDSTQVTGVCFKCGSTEHTSYKCPKKVEGYPLAKCFICKEQGHISKDCPKNEHGVYINGGKCSLCGNVNHLSKDCPSNKKEKDNVVTVDTINEGISVDAEMIEPSILEPLPVSKNSFHKKKVVKF